MRCNDIYEAMKSRKRFTIITIVFGVAFICQIIYFYSNPNVKHFELPDRDAEVIKRPIKKNKTIINTRNLFQGIKLHREIEKSKDSKQVLNNSNYTVKLITDNTEYTSVVTLSTAVVKIKSKAKNIYTYNYEQRNVSNEKKDDLLIYSESRKPHDLSTTKKVVVKVKKSNISKLPKRVKRKSKIYESSEKFNIDKDAFAAESNFNVNVFKKLPFKNHSKQVTENSFSNRSVSGLVLTSVKDHRIRMSDRTKLSRDEILFGTLKPKNLSQLKDEIRIVSMSLYGSDARYMEGALENAKLVKSNFPGWSLRFYVESPLSKNSKYGQVPPHVLEMLRSYGADIHYIVPEEDFLPPMMWRFLIADDPSVDRFIIRDADSRLTKRDYAAVTAWMRSGQAFQCIRDHPSHSGQSVSGGLWGGESQRLRIILRSSWIEAMRGLSSNYFTDMDFLQRHIWPKVSAHAYCSDSVSCERWPNSFPFPVQRYGFDHVGAVYDERGIGRRVDIRILQRHGENEYCLPPSDY